MFMEEPVIMFDPQLGWFTIICTGVDGVLLVTLMIRWSPGFTCNVGFWNPSGVMKQNNVLPSESVLVWYEKFTVSDPFELNRLWGLWTTLPAAGRGQGLATGRIAVCAKALTCARRKTAKPSKNFE